MTPTRVAPVFIARLRRPLPVPGEGNVKGNFAPELGVPTAAFQTAVLVIHVTIPEPMASGVDWPLGIVLKLESWLSIIGVPTPETGTCRTFIRPLSAQMTLEPSLTSACGVIAVDELATGHEEHVPPPHTPDP